MKINQHHANAEPDTNGKVGSNPERFFLPVFPLFCVNTTVQGVVHAFRDVEIADALFRAFLLPLEIHRDIDEQHDVGTTQATQQADGHENLVHPG